MRHAKKDPLISSIEIKKNLLSAVVKISVDTFKRQHFKAQIRRAARKPLLTARMLKERLSTMPCFKKVEGLVQEK